MSLHGPEISHVSGQQKGLLHSIGHIPNLPVLEVPYRGIHGKGSFVQHQRGVPSWYLNLAVKPPLHHRPFTWGSGMDSFGRFGSPLGLSHLGGKAISFLHHLLALLVPLPLLISRIRLGSLSRGKGGGLGLNVFLGTLPLAWDSSRPRRLDLPFRCINMALGIVESSWVWLTWAGGSWLKLATGGSKGKGWLKISILSLDSKISTTSSSSSLTVA